MSEQQRFAWCHGEERAVIQILVNLIGNAMRHSQQGGIIHLHFPRHGGPGLGQLMKVTAWMQLTSIGYSSGSNALPGGEGTGLGLAIPRQLLDGQ